MFGNFFSIITVILMLFNCSITLAGKSNLTVLCKAIVEGDFDKAYLITSIRPNLINEIEPLYDLTPLQLAVQAKQVKLIDVFLKQKGDVTKLSCTLRNSLHYCGQYVSTKKNPCLPILLAHGAKQFSQQKFFEWIEQKDLLGERPADNCKNFGTCLSSVLKQKKWKNAYIVYKKQLKNNQLNKIVE